MSEKLEILIEKSDSQIKNSVDQTLNDIQGTAEEITAETVSRLLKEPVNRDRIKAEVHNAITENRIR